MQIDGQIYEQILGKIEERGGWTYTYINLPSGPGDRVLQGRGVRRGQGLSRGRCRPRRTGQQETSGPRSIGPTDAQYTKGSHTYIYTYTHTYIHTHTHTYIHTFHIRFSFRLFNGTDNHLLRISIIGLCPKIRLIELYAKFEKI